MFPLQVTGPVLRFANQIAAQGYIVAAPNVFHEFAGNEPIPYDAKGTDDGNSFKVSPARDSLSCDVRCD